MLKVVLFAHEGQEKIVSKYCPNCGELKLTEEFIKQTSQGMLTSVCKGCHADKKETKQKSGEKGEVQ